MLIIYAGTQKRVYFGWRIYDCGIHFHPVTGRFVAYRHGIRIGANTEEALISMIDERSE